MATTPLTATNDAEYDDAGAKALADQCWKEDESFKRREKIAEWLGGHGQVNRRARGFYFANFDFAGLSVDAALRKLCDKLFLRAETQQVDRILSAFSLRYFECNPDTKLASADIVHALTFSILLLNTDLHIADMAERMTRQQFVRNTLDAISESHNVPSAKERAGAASWEVQMEVVLRDIYNSVKGDQIRLPLSEADKLTAAAHTPRSIRAAGTERVNALKRGSIRGLQGLMGNSNTSGSLRSEDGVLGGSSATTLPRRTATPDAQGRASLSSMAPFESPSASAATMGFANTLKKSIIEEALEEEDTSSDGSARDDITDEELALMGPPWAKEGLLTRKHYWRAPAKRAKDKNWVECFAVVHAGQFSMYKFGASTFSSGATTNASPAVGGGNWLPHATCIGQFSLAHSLTNILPSPGYNRARPHVFALTLSNGGVYFFQTAHEELAQEWSATCNYWAARLSKEPLAAGVSNMEYGWNRVTRGHSPSDEPLPSASEEAAPTTSDRSVAETATEELNEATTPLSPSKSHAHSFHASGSASASPYKNRNGADTRSIRSGRSARSSRIHANMTSALFQNWSSIGKSLDRLVSSGGAVGVGVGVGVGAGGGDNQSGMSSPVTSVMSLSTPGTSIASPTDRPMVVHEWRPPVPPTMNSALNEEEQLDACMRHTLRIEQELSHHNSLRQPMLKLFRTYAGSGNRLGRSGGASVSVLSLSPKAASRSGSGSGSGSSAISTAIANRALSNWERRSAYLLAELTKFQLYVDSLKSASRARAEKRDAQELSRMMRRADEELSQVVPVDQ